MPMLRSTSQRVVRELVPPCAVKRRPPLNFEESREALSYLLLADAWPGSRLLEFRDVFVSPYGALFKDGAVIPESIDYSLRPRRNGATFMKKIALGRVKEVTDTCAIGHNAFFTNYYHWLLEAMPRLYAVRPELQRGRLILCAGTNSFHAQSAALLQAGATERCGRDELIFAEHLLFPEPIGPAYGQHNPKLLARLAAELKRSAGIETRSGAPHRRLYIARRADKRRRLANGKAVEETLAQRGFESVILEDLSMAEQIGLFDCAEAVAGIHGAGLANVLFMRPGGVVIEFVSDRYPDGCLYNLAAACRHRTIVLPCETVGSTDRSGPKYYDIAVNLEKLRQWLDASELKPLRS